MAPTANSVPSADPTADPAIVPSAAALATPIPTLAAEDAARHVLAGRVVACPTEGVYGLSCDPRLDGGLRALAKIKPPGDRHGYLLIGASLDQLDAWMQAWDAVQRRQAEAMWREGPVNVVGPAPAWAPQAVVAREQPQSGAPDARTIGLRLCHHPAAATLCRAVGGALVSTSANPPGERPAATAEQARDYFGAAIAGVVEGELGGQAGACPIYSLVTGQWLRR